MSSFEAEFRDSMSAVDELLATTRLPKHREILENYRRHVYLETAGRVEDILSAEMTVSHPIYRIGWAGTMRVLDGSAAVRDFYTSLGHAEAVLWNTDEQIAVADWGFASELTLHQLVPGRALIADGDRVEDENAIYHLSSRQAFIWPYDENAKLLGEHIYEDVSTRRFERIEPEDAISARRAAELVYDYLE